MEKEKVELMQRRVMRRRTYSLEKGTGVEEPTMMENIRETSGTVEEQYAQLQRSLRSACSIFSTLIPLSISLQKQRLWDLGHFHRSHLFLGVRDRFGHLLLPLASPCP